MNSTPFEDWALSGHASSFDLIKDTEGNYIAPETLIAWNAWKGAVEAAANVCKNSIQPQAPYFTILVEGLNK
jgi:hypothetical protein